MKTSIKKKKITLLKKIVLFIPIFLLIILLFTQDPYSALIITSGIFTFGGLYFILSAIGLFKENTVYFWIYLIWGLSTLIFAIINFLNSKEVLLDIALLTL